MLLNWAGWAAFISFVFTALPVRYPKWWWSYGGITSDGLRALLIAREANEEKVNAKP